MTAIPLRSDFDAGALRSVAKKTKNAAQARRLLALAAVYDGATRVEAAKIGDVTLQIVRDWVMKFNAHGPDGLVDRKAPGQPPKLNDGHRAALVKMVEEGPTPAIHGVVRWRLIDLAQWMFVSAVYHPYQWNCRNSLQSIATRRCKPLTQCVASDWFGARMRDQAPGAGGEASKVHGISSSIRDCGWPSAIAPWVAFNQA